MKPIFRKYMFNSFNGATSGLYWRSELNCARCLGEGQRVHLSKWATEAVCSYCQGRGKAPMPMTELFSPGSDKYPLPATIVK